MALTDEMVMPVAPAYGGNGFGGDWGSWIILFLIFGMFGNGGWGMNGGGFGYDFPWLMSGQNGINNNTNYGFQNAAIQSSLGDIQTGLCGGFAGVTAAVNGAQANISQQLYTNQISDLERSFAAQTANTQGLNAMQSQLANCCCENRLATCQTQNIVQNEGNATRFADANNTRDLLTALNGGFQSIKDQLCDYRNEQKDDTIAQLRSELMYARGQASQDVQTAAIQAGQRALANEVEQYVSPKAIPAYMVQNPNCCYNPCGTNCGCGMG